MEEVFGVTSGQQAAIVMHQDSLQNYRSQLDTINSQATVPVGVGWLRECIIEGRYLEPSRFALRQQDQKKPSTKSHLNITEDYLHKLMSKADSSDKMMNYLSGCFIHLFKLPKEDEKMQRMLLHMGGGLDVTVLIQNLTHIVVESYDENDYKEFNKYSNVHIVNTRWLMECLVVKNRVPELDYSVPPTKTIQTQGSQSNDISRTQAMANKRGAAFEHLTNSSVVVKKQKTVDSLLFDKQYFCFCTKEKEGYKKFIQVILRNSGMVLKDLDCVRDKNIKVDKIFLVLEDGFDNSEFKEFIRGIEGEKFIVVSTRWIMFCIERNVLVKDYLQKGMGHLHPFPFKMPLDSFKNIRFYVDKSGISIDKLSQILETIDIVGATTVTSASDAYDYQLVYSLSSAQIQSNDEKMRDFKWLIQCVMRGEIS